MERSEKLIWQILSIAFFVRVIHPIFGVSAVYAMFLVLIATIVILALWIHFG